MGNGSNGDENGNGARPIDFGKQRWIVTPQFLYKFLAWAAFLVYLAVQSTIFLNGVTDEIRKLANVVTTSVMSYQVENRAYQAFDTGISSTSLCIQEWMAMNRSRPTANWDGRCDNRIPIFKPSNVDSR